MGTFDLRAIRKNAAEALTAATGLKRVYPYVVERCDATPAAYVSAGQPVEFNTTYGRGHVKATLRVVIVCGALDNPAAQEIQDRLLSQLPLVDDDESMMSPPLSVKDALEADQTLGGACQTVHVARAENLRAVTIAGVVYLAIDLVLEVNT